MTGIERKFILRLKPKSGVVCEMVIGGLETPEVQEICPICSKQGIVANIHEGDEHQGSPHFKPWRVSSDFLRKFADEIDQGRGAL